MYPLPSRSASSPATIKNRVCLSGIAQHLTQAYGRTDRLTARNAGMMRPAGFFICLFVSSICLHAQPALRWAADPNSNAPYTFYAQGKALAGFEYEIINAVARRLGRRAEFVQNDWNGLIPGLHRGLYDCVICGIEITPDKADDVNFSVPYYFTFEQFVGRRGTPPMSSLHQLRDRTVGPLDHTAALRMLEETPGVVVKTYDQELNAYQDVVNGRLFGVLLDYPIAKYYAAPNPELQLIGPPFGRIAYGIAIDKGNGALQREIVLRCANSSPAVNSGPSCRVGDSGPIWSHKPSANRQNLRRQTTNTKGSFQPKLRRQTFGPGCKPTSLPDPFYAAPRY
jgi:ABC-type amino acid transport substrate-binding protein